MTDAPDLFADDPSPRPTGPGPDPGDLFDGRQGDAPHAQQPQLPLVPQPQLAPRHAAHKAVGSQAAAVATNGDVVHSSSDSENKGPTPSEVGAAMQLSGQEIRVKEFRRALLRGYSRDDVDGFLTDVIKSFDACERTLMNAQPTRPHPRGTHNAPEPLPDKDELDREPAQREPKEALTELDQSADEIRAEAQAEAAHILSVANSQAQALRDEALQGARADAERGLMRARERARAVLQVAADREQQAARAEAETELRLAHIEQRLADKAKTVREQARHLDTLAAWLADQDLRPEDATAHGAVPAHAAAAPEPEGDVLAFKR